jgi:hypothetical protein
MSQVTWITGGRLNTIPHSPIFVNKGKRFFLSPRYKYDLPPFCTSLSHELDKKPWNFYPANFGSNGVLRKEYANFNQGAPAVSPFLQHITEWQSRQIPLGGHRKTLVQNSLWQTISKSSRWSSWNAILQRFTIPARPASRDVNVSLRSSFQHGSQVKGGQQPPDDFLRDGRSEYVPGLWSVSLLDFCQRKATTMCFIRQPLCDCFCRS